MFFHDIHPIINLLQYQVEHNLLCFATTTTTITIIVNTTTTISLTELYTAFLKGVENTAFLKGVENTAFLKGVEILDIQ